MLASSQITAEVAYRDEETGNDGEKISARGSCSANLLAFGKLRPLFVPRMARANSHLLLRRLREGGNGSRGRDGEASMRERASQERGSGQRSQDSESGGRRDTGRDL